MNTVYGTSPLKRRRRTGAQLDGLRDATIAILNGEAGQITIRHLFYRLVSEKVIEKSESAYKALCSHLMKWRRDGSIGWDVFTDSTRFSRGVRLVDSVREALDNAVRLYRRNLWLEQPHYIEVWCEKDTISPVLMDAVDDFGVRVFACRGFPSGSSLYGAGQTFKHYRDQGKATTIFYFGDHDPSGLLIDSGVKRDLADDHGVEINLVRLAVTADDIINWNLPTRPVKAKDTRAASWSGGCVEVDAMPMSELRRRLRDSITSMIDPHAWEQQQAIEKLELESLREFAAGFNGRAA